MGVVRDPVIVNGQTFNTSMQWWLDTLEGWESTAPLDMVVQPNGSGDGAVIGAASRAKERPLAAGGAVLGATRDEAELLIAQLHALFPRDSEIVVERFGKRMFAYLYDAIETDLQTPRGFRWTAPLLAVDPFKYSTAAVVDSAGIFTGEPLYRTYDPTSFYRTYNSVGFYRTYASAASSTGLALAATLVNDGNARTRRVAISVQGPLIANDWRIVNETTRETLVGAINVDAGRTLVLDTARQLATLDGQDVTDRVYGDWPSLTPGTNVLRLLAGTSNTTANIAVSALSAWR